MTENCMYCGEEMQDIGDSYLCMGTCRNPHYHRKVKEGKQGWPVEEGSKHFEAFVKRLQK